MTHRWRFRPVRRLIPLAAALLTAALTAVPMSGAALAQAPPTGDDNLALVNRDRQMVERKKDGEFVARPVFSRRIEVLFYALRHPDTGEWVTNTYRVQGEREAALRGLGVHLRVPGPGRASPSFTRSRLFSWCCPCRDIGGGDNHLFHALVPVHQPKGLVGQGAGRPGPGPLGAGPGPDG